MSEPPYGWDGKCRCCGQKKPPLRVWSYVICKPFRGPLYKTNKTTKADFERWKLKRRVSMEWRLIIRAKSFRVQQLRALYEGSDRKAWKDVQKIGRLPSIDKWLWTTQEQEAAVAAFNRRVREWEDNQAKKEEHT